MTGLLDTVFLCTDVCKSQFQISYPTLLKTVERAWRLVQTKKLSHRNTANRYISVMPKVG